MEKYIYKVEFTNKIDGIISAFTVESFWLAMSDFALKSKTLISNTNKSNRNIVVRTGFVKNCPSAVFMETETIDSNTGKTLFFVSIKTIPDRGVGCGFSPFTPHKYRSESYISALTFTAKRLNQLSKGQVEVGKVIACLASKNDKSELWVKKDLPDRKRKKEFKM